MKNVQKVSLISNWKLIEVMSALLFLVAPMYYHPNIGGLGFGIPNNITVWIVVTVIIFLSIKHVIDCKIIVVPKYFLLLFSLPFFLSAAELFHGYQNLESFYLRLFTLLGGVLFLLGLLQYQFNQNKLDRLFFVFVISAFIQGIIGLSQEWLSTHELFWAVSSEQGYIAGLFQQVNNQAVYQSTAILVSFFLVQRPFFKTTGFLGILSLFFAVTFSSYIVMLSGSRAGLFSLMIGLSILVPKLLLDSKKSKNILFLLLIATVIGFSYASFDNGGENKALEKLRTIKSGYSGAARLGIYSLTSDLITKQPITGYGVGSFGREFQLARPDFYEQNPDGILPETYVDHPHNEFLFWLVEGGVISLLGLFVFIYAVLLSLFKMRERKGLIYFSLLAPILLHTQVELPFYSSALMWFSFLLLLLPIFSNNQKIIKFGLSLQLSKFIQLILLLFFILINLFYFHAIKSNSELNMFYQKRSIDFNYASVNPIFKSDVSWLLHRTYTSALLEGDEVDSESINKLIDWNLYNINLRPDIDLYKDLISLYFLNQDIAKACKQLTITNNIYPKPKVFNQKDEYYCQ